MTLCYMYNTAYCNLEHQTPVLSFIKLDSGLLGLDGNANRYIFHTYSCLTQEQLPNSRALTLLKT